MPNKPTDNTDNDNFDDFDDIKESIDKEFGVGSLMIGKNSLVKVDIFPSGIPALDVALGVKGIPQGRIIELFGKESSGKTTTCLEIIAACQKHYFPKKGRYGRVVFIDAEHALDPTWANKIGVNVEKMAISQPDSGEQAFKIAEKLIDSKKVDLIIFDSVAALVPEAEILGDVGDHHIGAQARMMSQACRKISGKCKKTGTTLIFINQVREKIGVMFGNPEVTPGGRALKFYSSIRADITKGSALKEGATVVGFRPTIKIIKNKVAPPFTIAQFDICVGTTARPIYGVDKMASLIEVASRKEVNVIQQNGSWYSYKGQKLGNGLANASLFLNDNLSIANEIQETSYNIIFSNIDDISLDPIPIDDEISNG